MTTHAERSESSEATAVPHLFRARLTRPYSFREDRALPPEIVVDAFEWRVTAKCIFLRRVGATGYEARWDRNDLSRRADYHETREAALDALRQVQHRQVERRRRDLQMAEEDAAVADAYRLAAPPQPEEGGRA